MRKFRHRLWRRRTSRRQLIAVGAAACAESLRLSRAVGHVKESHVQEIKPATSCTRQRKNRHLLDVQLSSN
jgi:hypothetical protein